MKSTTVPIFPHMVKRGDYLRIAKPGEQPVDERVVSVRQVPDARVRVNTITEQGKRVSRTHEAQTCLRLVVSEPVVGLLRDHVYKHANAPEGVFLTDEVGDVAWRCGQVGAWLRIDGRWRDASVFWGWDSERRTWQAASASPEQKQEGDQERPD